ncbi:MAG: hypothetical protein ACPG9R_16995, partial [Marinobacter salsuginis]
VPMLVFAVLADQQAPLQEYARLALAATVVVLGSGIVLYPLAKVLKLNLKTFLPPMMFNNSGNMGIPLLVLAFGDEALPAAIVLFIVEMLLHALSCPLSLPVLPGCRSISAACPCQSGCWKP